MKKHQVVGLVAFAFALTTWTFTVRANVVGASASTTTPSAFILANSGDFIPPLPGSDAGLQVSGSQVQSAADVQDTVNTDTPGDPTIKLANFVDNDSAINWNSYGVTLSMPVPFTATMLPAYLSPTDWVETISPSNGVATEISPTDYEATVTYQVGANNDPILPGGELDFGYSVVYNGSTDSYTVTQTTAVNPVPEPGTLGLLAAGLLAATAAWRRRLA